MPLLLEAPTGAATLERRIEMNQCSRDPALQRLETHGLITSEWGVIDNNRQARYHRITAAGRRAPRRRAPKPGDDLRRAVLPTT